MNQSEPSPLITVASLIIFLWGLAQGRPFLVPLLISAFIAFLMAPLHRLLVRKLKLPDALAVVFSAFIFLSPIVYLGFLLIQQGKGLTQDIPQLISSAQLKLQDFTTNNPLVAKIGLDSDFENILKKLSNGLGQDFGILIDGLTAIADVGSQMILIFIFSVLFLASRKHLRKSAEHILESRRGLQVNHLLDQATDLVQQFLVARMTIVAIIGILAAFSLKLLDVKYCLFLGTLFGLLTLVPAIGALIGILSAFITALVTGHSFGSALIVAAVLLGISSLENYYLSPKMVGNRLNLNALTCFIGLFAGGLLWGVWGMFLSVPLLGVLRVVFSAFPSLQPWGELIADKTDAQILDLTELSRKPGSKA